MNFFRYLYNIIMHLINYFPETSRIKPWRTRACTFTLQSFYSFGNAKTGDISTEQTALAFLIKSMLFVSLSHTSDESLIFKRGRRTAALYDIASEYNERNIINTRSYIITMCLRDLFIYFYFLNFFSV